MAWRAAVVLLGAGWLAAQNAPPVPDIRQLEVPHHQGQSYWMFAPANYTADQAWPILNCLDPAARGRVPVERFAAAAAFGFFLGTVPARPAPASQEAEKQAAQYDRWMERIQSADENERRSVIRLAQKDAAREQDSPARRVARRVIGGVSVGAMESTRELMAQERYGDAARTAEEAVFARPENSGGWYALALASAAAGNTNRSLEAVEQAA